VKNVAGFNLTTLLIGSFGAFGMITSAHVRLNATPVAEKTLVIQGEKDVLLGFARAISTTGTTPAAMELSSADARDQSVWNLSIRLIGSESAVAADRRNIAAATSNLGFDVLDGDSSVNFWASAQAAASGTAATVRMGCPPSELEPALELLSAQLDRDANANVSVSILAGVTRWNGDANVLKVQNMRNLAAERGWPVTVERAPWEILNGVGHYGAFRSGVGPLVTSLRGVFDRRGLLVAPLGNVA
jgi:FAD/FMN-containing dehydrogenase